MQKKILVIDDLAANRRILAAMLRADYNVVEAADGETALRLLSDSHGDVSAVLLDIVMPGIDGYEVLRRIRKNAALSQLSVIMITGSEDEESRTKALALGADDFVMKPYNSEVIKHCLKNNIVLRETASIVDALRRDKLTGLYTREAFFDKVAELVAAHEPGYYIMACFDVDKFKVINDQYGTEKGDEVLRHIAHTFETGFMPHGGLCCRVASDNFAVLYPASFLSSTELPEIRRAASRIDWLISPIVFSIGRYTVVDPAMKPSAMYDRAILAENSVKGRYDVRIAVYDDSMRAHLIHEQEIVTEMEGALESRQFEVWYQPQYNHSTGALVGAEALVRWRHPEKGLIPPNDFIPIFEQNGFIYALDKYVWEEVCRFLRKGLDEGGSPLPVSVNISRYDVFRPDILEVITGLTERYNIPATLLRLEITESAFAESTQQIIAVVKRLIDGGFTVEIDDFGSGYSSLNTLKSVPAQVVKLDMHFFEDSDGSQRSGNIVESIVRMTKWLGMSVIAEGVEVKAQADFLRSIGCNYIQGYLYARPMPADEYTALCKGTGREEKLLTLETVENLDNNAFWDPKSMDTLIFNSYVGGACIYEYHNGGIELLRATEKYAQVIGSAGMTVEDALKLNWTEHLDAESGARVIRDLESSIATRKEVTGEYVFLDLPGCPHETHLRSTMRVIASAGDRYLVYCTNENITAQREAEKNEHKLAAQMQAILDNVDLGIIAATVENGDAQYVFANDRYYDMLGYTKAQFESEVHSPYATVAPEDRERVKVETTRIERIGESTLLMYNALLRDGRRRIFRAVISVSDLAGMDGPVQLSILRDITEEAAAAAREKQAAEQMQSMMGDMPGGFVRLRVCPDGSLAPVYFNEGFCKLTGMNREELMALYAVDVFSCVFPDDLAALKDTVAKIRDFGDGHSVRYRRRRGDGSYVWLMIFGRATKDAAGDSFLNIYYTDVTEQVKAEQQQKELLDNLTGGAALYEYDGRTLTIVHLNRRYWELVGRPPVSCEGLSPVSALHPDDLTVLMREIASAVSQKRDMVCDIRLRHEAEGYRPFHVVGRITPKAGGKYAIYTSFELIADEVMSYQQMLPVILSTIMDSTTDLSFAKDKDFRYICGSRAFTTMLGLENGSDIIGKTDYDIFDKALADKYRRDDETLVASGSSLIDMVEAIPSADGVPHYSSTSKYLLRDADGNLIGLYGVGRDITEYRDAFDKLKLLTDSLPGGIATYECSKDSIRLLYCNDGFCRLFGTTHEAYEKQAASEPIRYVFQEDLPMLRAQIAALIEDGTPIDCTYRAHVEGGGYRWISHRAVAADRRGGNVIVHAMLQDVTQQRELTERLRQSEEENALALHLGGNIVSRYTVADRTLSITPETAALYCLPETVDDVPYGPVRRGLLSPESADVYTQFFEDILHGCKTGSAIFRQQFLNEWRWLEAKSATVFSDAGEPVKAIISFIDVTEMQEKESVYKKWQQSLAEKNADSYTLFRCNLVKDASLDTVEGNLLNVDFSDAGPSFDEHTRAYVQQCVFPTDQEAYTAFLRADRLLAGYYRGKRSDALEYRELLPDSSVRWLRLTVELVEYPNSTDIEAYLMYENINEAKRSALKTQELAETDPLTRVLNRTTFAARVGQVLRASRQEARHALIMLDIDGFKQVNDAFGHIMGDRALADIADALRAILRPGDLIGRLGGDEFQIFLPDITDESGVASMAQQICALTRKAFSLEVQISGSVGVAIAPRDGADYDTLYKNVDSALYYVKGSGKNNYVFYRDDMEDEHLRPEADDAAEPEARRRAKRRRMLIVDDSTVDYELLANIFKDEFIIEKARDGASALIRLRHYGAAVSVILLDLFMPVMDGFAVLEKLQESAELQAIPVIIVSGDESRETCLKTIRSGATDFITKPVDPELLRLRVHSAVSRAENERLRAQNRLLELRNDERIRYEAAMNDAGVAVVEFDWLSGEFIYYPSVSKCLAGNYNHRKLWHILLSDLVADTLSVQRMQQLVHTIAEDRERMGGSLIVELKTPDGSVHPFRVSISKLINEYHLTSRLIITLVDLSS